ncbi:MAG: hypothetical protein P4L99_14915 [Chthoniobacter sp.]|nr:hypothetical protein [Chthoniobacter sp.]
MNGFRKLIERLKDDGVETDKRFGSEALAVWWREHFGENEGVSETTDYYCSNRLPVRSLPGEVTVIRLEKALPDNFDYRRHRSQSRRTRRCFSRSQRCVISCPLSDRSVWG